MFRIILNDKSIEAFVEQVNREYFLDVPDEETVSRLDVCEDVFATITNDYYSVESKGKFDRDVLHAYKGIVHFIEMMLRDKFGLDDYTIKQLEFNRFSFIDGKNNVFLELR